MSRPSVDLTNCDREPIHILGAIQLFGGLIAVTSDWLISRVSANIANYVGRDARELLGKPLAGLLTDQGVHDLRNRATLLRHSGAVERMFGMNLIEGQPPFDVAIHLSGRLLVIEFEPASQTADATSVVRGMIHRLDETEGMASFLHQAARQVRAVTGFDRVMIYRFDETGSGEVVAEARNSTVDSFLGLHYPASDIPAQARALYLRNIFRIIADVSAEEVPIIPELDGSGQPLDLSMSVLRSVSPIHIEYLKNMGVGASLSISIVVEGKLWGLFACHHYAPRLPGFTDRTAAELFGQIFSLKLEARERQITSEYENRARDIAQRLLTGTAHDAQRLADAEWLGSIVFESVPADGVAVVMGGAVTLSGLTPSEDEVRSLASFLNAQPPSEIFHTAQLSSVQPDAASYANKAAGMLSIPISRAPRDYVLLFRAEQLRSVRWAGEPSKPVEIGPNGDRLTPRKSFEEWSEIVRNTSVPFSKAELRVADALRISLLEVILKLSDDRDEARRQNEERQTLLIAELNHRVRNILALIRALMNQTKATSDAPEVMFQSLDERIQALARAHNQITADHWGPAPLRRLLQVELDAFLGEKRSRVRLSGPDVKLTPEAFTVLALVTHEMTTNAAKYGALSDNGSVDINWRVEPDMGLVIDWTESGGPTVSPPTRRGVGSNVIERSVEHDLQGKAETRFDPAGFSATLTVPLRFVVIGSEERSSTDIAAEMFESSGGLRPVEGLAALFVEDNLIIAMDGESILEELGAREVHIAATTAAALDIIKDHAIDIAVLDLNLGTETSLVVADRLAEQGIPFVFASGYGESQLPAAPHGERVMVAKPYDHSSLADALGKALAEKR